VRFLAVESPLIIGKDQHSSTRGPMLAKGVAAIAYRSVRDPNIVSIIPIDSGGVRGTIGLLARATAW
jgi:hypothetical protein